MAGAYVFFDGFATTPRLDHPESVAVHPDGSLWCGGEAGQVFRIAADGSGIEQLASTGGFLLGVTFDPACEHLYLCDMIHHALFRYRLADGTLERFADGAEGRRLRTPNAIVFTDPDTLYVTDSWPPDEPGPAVYRFRVSDGAGEVWYPDHLPFANGMALAPGGDALVIAESFLPGVGRIPINPDGSPGTHEVLVELPGTVPDGVAYGPDGTLYVALYEPSRVLAVSPAGAVSTLAEDPTAHLLAHPTNVALRDTTLFAANLGRWHLTAIPL